MGKGWCDIDPNELFFTFGGYYVCVSFGENRSRNATVRVPTDGLTDTLTDAIDFIICPMLYAVAMGLRYLRSCVL